MTHVGPAPDRIVHGCCPMDCPDTCSWSITVKDGKAVKLEGRRDHPFTAGALCAKMNSYLDYVARPDRLQYPLRRVGPKGTHEFERITWSEAIEEIASNIRGTIERDGPQSIWPYYGVGSFGMIQGLHGSGRRFWNAIGASQHLVTICTIAGGVGMGFTLGDNRMGMDPETIEHAKLVILWGTNTLSTNAHSWKFVDRARRQNGAKIVVIDPVKTRTAGQADRYLQITPGTDAVLALSLINVIVKLGLQDESFIREHTLGWEDLKARAAEYPPEVASAVTGIDAETIRWLGTEIANSRPTAIRIAQGMQRHAGGGMALRTITCLPGVTGDWRHPGGGLIYDTRGYFKGNWAALYRDDLRPPGTRTLSMTRLADNVLNLNDPPIKMMFIWMANPVASNPDQNAVRAALSKEGLFTVAIDQFHNDTTLYADIVLPGTAQPEHADLHMASGHIYLAWNEPAVAPPGECLPHTEIFRRLAAALCLEEPSLYASDEELARDVLSSDHPWLAGTTLEELKRVGFVRPSVPKPAAVFANGFPNASGKLEFVSERMAKQGYDPIAGYTPPRHALSERETGLARLPFILVTPAAHNFLNSIFGREDLAHFKREGRQSVFMNRGDAEAAGLSDGRMVRVSNHRGSFVGMLKVGEQVGPGVLAAPKGYWPSSNGNRSNVNAVVEERDSDMGGAIYSDNRVRIEAEAEDQALSA